MPVPRPIWGADCPVSMPLPAPADEPRLINMFGFSFTQYRLVHDISAAEYESMSVPIYAPSAGGSIADDAAIDNAPPA
jgi:hypothetical protein